jgi:hypothetical protein
MRHVSVIAVAVFLAAACSDAGVNPTGPGSTPPAIRASHTATSGSDLCAGYSPCDGFDGYWHSAATEPATGAYIVAPGVNNHSSEYTGDFVPGLGATAVGANDGQLQVYSCPIDETSTPYPREDVTTGVPTDPPPVVDCSGANKVRWPDPVWAEGSEFYVTQLQFQLKGQERKVEPKPAHRIYMTAGDRHLVHRDIRLCTSDFSPADASIYCIGTGTIPFKVSVRSDLGCVSSDANGEFGSEESATCLVAGNLDFSLEGLTAGVDAAISIEEQAAIDAFIATFSLSECESIADNAPGMDLRFLGCKVTIDAPTDAELTNAATIFLSILDDEGLCAAAKADPNDELGSGCVIVLEDGDGQQMLPTNIGEPTPIALSPMQKLLGAGLNKLAALFGAKPLVAVAVGSNLSGNFRSLSEIQAAVRTTVGFPDGFGSACSPPEPACTDLGTVTGPTTVTAQATAPTTGGDEPVEGVRVHFFPDAGGTAACLAGDSNCDDSGGTWTDGQTVVLTDVNGDASVEWTLGVAGQTTEMKILVCGGAIAGSNTPRDHDLSSLPESAGDYVWGTLQTCDRDPTDEDDGTDGSANGPAAGRDPFESDSPDFSVAANDLPLTVKASGCPVIDADGERHDPITGEDEWPDGCVGKFDFTANTTGKPKADNATLRWTNDGDSLYVSIEIVNAQPKDLNDAFFYFDVNPPMRTVGSPYPGVIQEGDDVVVMRLDETPITTDHFVPASCDGTPKATLCSSADNVTGDQASGAATVDDTDGDGDADDLFWEFSKALTSASCPNNSEDFCLASGSQVGGSWTITRGDGGGKGGTTAPDGGGFLLIEID